MRQGEFPLTLGEDKLLLRCSPLALRTILKDHGGIYNVIHKINMIEYQVMEDLIVAGLKGGKEEFSKDVLQENIFYTGIMNLVEPLSQYVELLGNGGMPPVKEDKETGKV